MRRFRWKDGTEPELPGKPFPVLRPVLLLVLTALFVLTLAALAAAVHALLLLAPMAVVLPISRNQADVFGRDQISK